MYIALHVKHPLLFSDFNETDRFSKNAQISNFTKIRPERAELIYGDERTRRHDTHNSRLS